jgi:hypothetical protein
MTDVIVTEDRIQTVVVTRTPQATVSVATPVSTSVIATETESVDVHQLGITGPAGPEGPPGPQGTPGVAAIDPFVWNQDVPAAVWRIPHNLNTYPLVTVVDSANQMVFGDIAYLDPNVLQISFGSAFSGVAYLL